MLIPIFLLIQPTATPFDLNNTHQFRATGPEDMSKIGTDWLMAGMAQFGHNRCDRCNDRGSASAPLTWAPRDNLQSAPILLGVWCWSCPLRPSDLNRIYCNFSLTHKLLTKISQKNCRDHSREADQGKSILGRIKKQTRGEVTIIGSQNKLSAFNPCLQCFCVGPTSVP